MAKLALSSERMHLSPIGSNRRCFLASSALCAIVLLLIPTLQTPQHRSELPRPLPRSRPAGGENTTSYQGSSSTKQDGVTGLPFLSDKSQRDAADAEFLSSRSNEPLGLKDVFIAVKTTRKYHKSRLELLLQTWVSKAKEQVGHTDNNHVRCGSVGPLLLHASAFLFHELLGAERRSGIYLFFFRDRNAFLFLSLCLHANL